MALILSAVLFGLVSMICLNVALGARKIACLKDVPIDQNTRPKVSIIVTALNEADTIEPALKSLLSIDYPMLEIIVINDRSTDATPVILEKIAADHPSLHVVHIDVLPAGWLGKNHALQQGAQIASGDYLLFTDADVVFAQDAVSRAVSYCQMHAVDHLTLLFDVVARTELLRIMLLSFGVAFMARFQPWKVNRSADKFVGIGGFNMVRRDAYLATGGHAAIPMAVLDDLALGQLLKNAGYLQHVLLGVDMVSVEWYRSTPDLSKGIEKNIFAAFDYQLMQLVGVTILMFATRVWPWLALLVTDGTAWWFSAATVLAGLALYGHLLLMRGWSLRCLVFAPIVPLLELWMWWKGSLSTLGRGGIVWRGTFYPLKDIKDMHTMSNSFTKKRGT
jgi:glycosyltransferase involved in cell wall biosynthesis